MKTLCPSQTKIYDLLVDGMTNKQIAGHLGISIGTVKNHITTILRIARKQTRLKLVVAHYKAQQ